MQHVSLYQHIILLHMIPHAYLIKFMHMYV